MFNAFIIVRQYIRADDGDGGVGGNDDSYCRHPILYNSCLCCVCVCVCAVPNFRSAYYRQRHWYCKTHTNWHFFFMQIPRHVYIPAHTVYMVQRIPNLGLPERPELQKFVILDESLYSFTFFSRFGQFFFAFISKRIPENTRPECGMPVWIAMNWRWCSGSSGWILHGLNSEVTGVIKSVLLFLVRGLLLADSAYLREMTNVFFFILQQTVVFTYQTWTPTSLSAFLTRISWYFD